LDSDVRLTTLQLPIRELSTTLGKLQAPVTIQLPEWTTVRVEGRVDLAPGETLLLAAEDGAADRIVLDLLGARMVVAAKRSGGRSPGPRAAVARRPRPAHRGGHTRFRGAASPPGPDCSMRAGLR